MMTCNLFAAGFIDADSDEYMIDENSMELIMHTTDEYMNS